MNYKELLIGAKLKYIDESGITIIDTKGEERKLDFIIESESCCGFADVLTNLLITQDELKNNPIISNINVEDIEEYDENIVNITLCGISKKLAEIRCEASSSSGYPYGASVSIRCKLLNIDDVICVH